MKQFDRLSFCPNKLYREYGSNIYFKTQKGVDRIQFRTSIIYAGSFNSKYHIFHLYKHDILINNTKPDDHIYRLGHACNKAFYPLIILCNNNGKILDIRHDTVWNRWIENRYSIAREFRGVVAEKYIESTEENLKNKENRSKLVSKDYFFKTYFSLNYLLSNSLEKTITYPLIPFEKNVKCQITQRLLKSNGNHTHSIEQKGIITDDGLFNYNKVCNEYGKEKTGKIKGESIVNYTLENNIIDSIKARFTVRKEDGELLIKTVMQSYCLSEYTLSPIEDKDSILYAKRLSNDNKKSLWERFNNYLNKPL